MSVYTEITRLQLEQLLNHYSVGELIDFEGIPNGVENTNYRVLTTAGVFVLTLFEDLDVNGLEHVLKLLAYLDAHCLPCSYPIKDNAGNASRPFCTKPAALFKWISGNSVLEPTVDHCYQIGLQLGKLHLSTASYYFPVVSSHDLVACKVKYKVVEGKLSAVDQLLIQDEFDFQDSYSLSNLPEGVIHGDLFKDNVLFFNDEVSGLLDFYSASAGVFLLDVAITVNDWCVNQQGILQSQKTAALLSAYQKLRPMPQSELSYLPILLRAAALRFWLSRLEKEHFPRQGVMTHTKDPLEFRRLLENYRLIQ